MLQGNAEVVEIYWDAGRAAARLVCDPRLIPAPGRYLQAHAPAESDAPLPVSVFSAGSTLNGFLAAPPWPVTWTPGTRLSLRGPLGHGFRLPTSARQVALAALDESPARLLGLLPDLLARDAAIVLLADNAPADLPIAVEVQPLSALAEVSAWADFLALDLPRNLLPELGSRLGRGAQAPVPLEAQALVKVPMPCGALAECGVCAVSTRYGIRLACKEGPVFDLGTLL
jgi:hypothetical protein